jgi:Effector Associated Constant Component 1
LRIVIHVEGANDGADLMRWLAEDPIAMNASFSPVTSQQDDAMGLGDVIQTVIDNTTALGGLVVAIAAWRDSRNARIDPPPAVRIERNGVTATITSADPAEVERITRLLSERPREPGNDDPPARSRGHA